MLSSDEVKSFIDSGYLVIPGVLTDDEIQGIRDRFHLFLKSKGVNHNDLENSAENLSKLSSTGGSGGVLDVFYESFKLEVNENPKIFAIISQLFSETFSSSTLPFYEHPFGQFDPNKAYMYIDRVCYRVSDGICQKFSNGKKLLQRSLTPHLDVCPHKLYDNINKWKPIQCFIALTDTLESNLGGFETCPGFHRQFDGWMQHRKPAVHSNGSTAAGNPPCVGSFSPIRPVEDADVIQQFQHISCRAGDLVCWDYRLPHANSKFNFGDTREVIYLGFLPCIELNRRYAEEQLKRLNNNEVPTDQWHSSKRKEECVHIFSTLGKKLLTIEEWT